MLTIEYDDCVCVRVFDPMVLIKAKTQRVLAFIRTIW